MSRRITLGLLAASLVAVLLIVFLARPHRAPEPPVRSRVAGDVAEVVETMPGSELPVRARGYLETNRPWRAARTMERYLEEAEAPTDADRVLAARAEGGWESWGAVLSLLQDVEALETYEGGVGLYLLGRAREHAGEDEAAVEAYRAFLSFSPPGGRLETERSAARLRLGLALIRTGERGAGEAALEEVAARESPWLRILEADALAAAGDTAAVAEVVAGLDEGIPGLRAWRARVEAARAAGDLAGARALANRARGWASTEGTRSEFLLLAARLARAMGDEAAARDAFRTVIDRNAGGGHSRMAAALLQEGEMSPSDRLAVARVLVAQGLHEEALEGFEAWLDAGVGTSGQRGDVRLEYATALFYAQRFREAVRALEPIRDRLSGRLLLARAQAHRGEIDEAVEIYRSVARTRAGSGTGRNALFLAAGTLHDAGEVEEARQLYEEVVSRYPGSGRMGLAMMRLAGMAFEREEYGAAAELWDEYRRRYPRGDRAMQATYWTGRARAEAGDSAAAAALFREVREQDRDSYYALLASRRLDEPFWPLPMSESPPADPEAAARVAGWMDELDLLRDAGYDAAASALADQLVQRVGGDRGARFALAEALATRGYSQGAIRIGITLETDGPPSRRLLQILFPFPYRTLISEEARDRGLDPFIAAALIRQESMFERRITSPAGARGLMQIMPATGRRLAEAVGMDRWDAELLYLPEINVHLGTRYVAQQMDEYDGSLPSVFSAYNAGPHRVEWWSDYPEYGEEELFTERIPYAETRGYVKILTRNRALYDGLYSGEARIDG